MKRMRSMAVGLFLLFTFLYNVFRSFGLENMWEAKSPAYIVGGVSGLLAWLIPALIFLYRAKNKGVYRCDRCKKKMKEDRNWRKKFGNPFFVCPDCGEVNYDDMVLEPALCSEYELEEIKRRALNEGKLGSFLIPIFVMVISYRVLYGAFPKELALIVGLFGGACFVAVKMSKELSFEDEIRKSMLRLKSDERYFEDVVKFQGIARDSAWKKQEREETALISDEILTEEEKEELFEDVREISFVVKDRRWIFILLSACFLVICTGVYCVQNVVGLNRTFTKLEQVTAKGERACTDVEGILGAVAETSEGYVYITAAGKDLALVYIPHADMDKYTVYKDWLFSSKISQPEPTVLYGYSVQIDEKLAGFVLEALQYNFGDIYGENAIEEMFGKYYIEVEDISKMKAENIGKMIYVLIVAGIGFVWAFGTYFELKKKEK